MRLQKNLELNSILIRMSKGIHKLYREDVVLRFLTAMNQIIAARKDGCKSDKDFAISIGEYQQNISKMVKGERYPTIDLIGRVCDIYHISPTWLIQGKGMMFEPADINAGIASLEQRMSTAEKQIELMSKKINKK